jgi:hypothetical protein
VNETRHGRDGLSRERRRRTRLQPGEYGDAAAPALPRRLPRPGRLEGNRRRGLGVGAITTTANFAVDRDLDNDGELASSDCNDANPAIRHGVIDTPDDGVDQNCDGVDSVNLDRDRDGETRPGDCNDNDPAIKHAAIDVPGNAIDEDCSGSPATFPRLGSTVRTAWRLNPFRLTKLRILGAVAGSRVEIRCKGRSTGGRLRSGNRGRSQRRLGTRRTSTSAVATDNCTPPYGSAGPACKALHRP